MDRLPDLKKLGADVPKEAAIRQYAETGGVVRVEAGRIVYPDKARIAFQLEEAHKRRAFLDGIIRELEGRLSKHEYDSTLSTAKRFMDPLYWEHVYKYNSDDEYKVAFDKVEPPVEKLGEVRWRSVVKMFVQNEEYRDRLVEAKTSVIAEGQGTMKERLEKTLESNRDLMQQRLDKLRSERTGFEKREKVLRELHRWID